MLERINAVLLQGCFHSIAEKKKYMVGCFGCVAIFSFFYLARIQDWEAKRHNLSDQFFNPSSRRTHSKFADIHYRQHALDYPDRSYPSSLIPNPKNSINITQYIS